MPSGNYLLTSAKGQDVPGQKDISITGSANNMDGQYQITGKVVGSTFSFVGKSDKNEYTANCTILSSDEFEGTYNTSTGGSGRVEAERQQKISLSLSNLIY